MNKELFEELRQIEDRLFDIVNETDIGELCTAWSSLYSYLEKIDVNELE